MDSNALAELVILIILILLSAFFSSAETAYGAVNRISLKTKAEEGDRRAGIVLKILNSYSKFLNTVLICNNVVNLSASALCTSFVIRYLGEAYVSAGTAVLTVLIILFGEITPKNVAMLESEKISRRDAPLLRALMVVLTPVVFVIDILAGWILKLMGVDANARHPITENELKTYVEASQQDGAIEGGEKKLIDNVFDFGDHVAKDIMIPRIDMCCVPSDATYDDVLNVFRREMFTRIPVYDADNSDKLIGHINMKDFILLDHKDNFSVRDILRESYYTYEYKHTSDLMLEMQQKGFGITFVIDEYGVSVGMITMEDLIEEIVGEIRDEYDEDEKDQLRKYDDLTYIIDGNMKLDDINDRIGSNFSSEDYDSIGGLMIEKLERLPHNNETVTLEDGTKLQAKGIRSNRIIKVLIRFHDIPGRKDEPEEEGHKQEQ